LKANEEKCFGCEACIPYCPVEAISMGPGALAVVDEERCVECGNCQRATQDICGVFFRPEESLKWPRVIRAALSDVCFESPLPKVQARGGSGAGEKTNDVDGNLWPGDIGMQAEFGRPNSGVSFRDIEKITRSRAQLEVTFDPFMSTTLLMDDPSRGTFPEEVLQQRALTVSVSIVFKTDEAGFDKAMELIAHSCRDLKTLSVITLKRKIEPGETLFPTAGLDRLGLSLRPNGKICLGLGRPLFDFSGRRNS
jgi:ferredoxin